MKIYHIYKKMSRLLHPPLIIPCTFKQSAQSETAAFVWTSGQNQDMRTVFHQSKFYDVDVYPSGVPVWTSCHYQGFSPVWIRRCLFKSPLSEFLDERGFTSVNSTILSQSRNNVHLILKYVCISSLARVITNTSKYQHITPTLKKLHCVGVKPEGCNFDFLQNWSINGNVIV